MATQIHIRIPKYIEEQAYISPEITLHKTCQNCGKKYEKKKECNFKKCAKCKKAWYCSRDCQKEDWKTHKKKCGNFGDKPITSPSIKFGNALNIHKITMKDTVFNTEVGNIWSYYDEDDTTYILKTIEFEEFKSFCMNNGLGHINFDYFEEELKTRNKFLYTPTSTVW